MTCPRCNNEWDVSKSPCPRCGLKVNLPFRSSSRSATSHEPGIPQTPHQALPLQPANVPFDKPHTDGNPFSRKVPGMRQVPNTQPEREQPSGLIPAVRQQRESSMLPLQTHPITPFPSRIPPIEQQQTNERREFGQNVPQALPILPEPSPHFDMSASPLMDSVQPVQTSAPDYDNNPFLGRLRRDDTLVKKSTAPAEESGSSENIVARNVPHRPQGQPASDRSTENLLDTQRPIRPSRLVTDSLTKEQQPYRSSVSNSPPSTPLYSSSAYEAFAESLPTLVLGTLLRGGRYRLRESQGRQDWRNGVYETTWIAQDAQRAGAQVTICELVTPESKSMVMQSTLRNATMALTSVGRHSHIPTLWDAFSDQGRSFFVFEPIEGESLMAYMRRTGRALPEQDVIECCLQMTEILELLAQQSPPLVHGLIRPAHIIIGRMGPEYTLTNFSIVLAGGATQYVTDIDSSLLSPYTAPEFVRGMIDGRADLYALMATAYHAVTGSLPTISDRNIPPPQKLNPTVSFEFDAILTRGLRPNQAQRYQRPSELRQDLLTIRSVNGTLTARSGPSTEPEAVRTERPVSVQTARTIQPTAPSDTSLSQVLPTILGVDGFGNQDQRLLLPRPEDLEPMPVRDNSLLATFWLVGILLCLVIIVIVSRGIL